MSSILNPASKYQICRSLHCICEREKEKKELATNVFTDSSNNLNPKQTKPSLLLDTK